MRGARTSLHEDLHATAQAEHEVQRRLLLDVVVRERAAVLELLAREDQALLVRGDACVGKRAEGEVSASAQKQKKSREKGGTPPLPTVRGVDAKVVRARLRGERARIVRSARASVSSKETSRPIR